MGPAQRRGGGSGVELTLGFGASDVSRPDKEGGIPASRFDPCAPQSREGEAGSRAGHVPPWEQPSSRSAVQPPGPPLHVLTRGSCHCHRGHFYGDCRLPGDRAGVSPPVDGVGRLSASVCALISLSHPLCRNSCSCLLLIFNWIFLSCSLDSSLHLLVTRPFLCGVCDL